MKRGIFTWFNLPGQLNKLTLSKKVESEKVESGDNLNIAIAKLQAQIDELAELVNS